MATQGTTVRTEDLRITVALHGHTCRVTLHGELDLSTAGIVSAVLDEVAADTPDVVVDTADVRFVDPAGARAVRTGDRRSGVVRLGSLSPAFRRLLETGEEHRMVESTSGSPDAGTPHVDRDAVDRTVQRLEAPLADGQLTDGIVTTLHRICEGLVGVFDVSGSGLLFLDDDAVPRYVVASDDTGRVLEMAQEQLGEGPCVDALVKDEVVLVEDFTADPRWPELAAMVVPEGIVSMVGIPVELAGGAVGSLNVFRDRPWPWDRSELEALSSFNRLVEHALTIAILAERNEVLVQQLQDALDGRVVIERAVGLTMGRLGVDPVTAFNELRSTARAQRIRVRELAAQLLDQVGGSPG